VKVNSLTTLRESGKSDELIVHENETGELAREFIEKAYWREHLASRGKPLVLHSDSNNVHARHS